MKIPYKKSFQRLNLFLGILWMFQFLFNWYEDNEFRYSNLLWLILSLTYLGAYFYNQRARYITIENGFIKQNWPFGKQVKIGDVTNVKYFAGDYTLTTKNGEFKINTHLLNQDYFEILKKEIDKIQTS